jgi:hypothetical protein
MASNSTLRVNDKSQTVRVDDPKMPLLIRLRSVPCTPDKVLAALRSA